MTEPETTPLDPVAGETSGLAQLVAQLTTTPVSYGLPGRIEVSPGTLTYFAVSAVVDRFVDIQVADSVREGWYDGDCVCEWHTSGAEPVVEDAAHEHVGRDHKAEVDAERVFLAAARAYCVAKFPYDHSYSSEDGRERHIAADMLAHVHGPSFRASVAAAIAAAAAVYGPAPAAPQRCDLAAGTHVTPHVGCILR